jgi:hypothetical protein
MDKFISILKRVGTWFENNPKALLLTIGFVIGFILGTLI